MTLPVALVLAGLLGAVTGTCTPALLRRLPEPAPAATADESEVKIPYAELATPRFAAGVAVVSAMATTVSAEALPIAVLPGWSVLSTIGVLLAAIDARTTWLPLPLTRIGWVAMALALIAAGLLGGGPVLLRGVAGFALAGALFGLVWLVSRGGFGFGDVRYAPLVGAAAASVSWALLAWALVLGSLVGAVVGLVRLAAGRRAAFAYAPSLLIGGYLAVAAAWLTT